jgi:starvation-inducible outer membrane lipoprotein
MKRLFAITAALLLSACVSPQKIEKTESDAAAYKAARQAREADQQCSQTALPGTPQHLACRLAKTNNAP